MDDYTRRTLSEIHGSSFSRLVEQIVDLQKFLIPQIGVGIRAEQLRFVSINGVITKVEESGT